jgi:hypothetical protein
VDHALVRAQVVRKGTVGSEDMSGEYALVDLWAKEGGAWKDPLAGRRTSRGSAVALSARQRRAGYSKNGTPGWAYLRIPSSLISTPMPGFSDRGMWPSTNIGPSKVTISLNIGSLWK